MRTIYIITALMWTFLSFTSCKEEVKGALINSDETPMPVSNIKVENGAGSAKISYTLPDDPNIAYVEATYTRDGEKRVNISSPFQNSITIEGLYETSEQVIELVTVNKFNNRSTTATVSIHPLTPPIIQLVESIEYGATFGGIYYRFDNEYQHEYVIHTIVRNPQNEWEDYDRYYSSKNKELANSVRGLDSIPTFFGVYVEDVWSNISDTIFFELTPLYEVEFDKDLWVQYNLADDSNIPRYTNRQMKELWSDRDGLLDLDLYWFLSPTMPGLVLPNWFTIDLGAAYKFGRMKVHNVQHGSFWQYAGGTPKTFEIWATNEPSTNWYNWTLLGSFECVKPSGIGVITDEDLAQLRVGDEYEFAPQGDNDFYRYVRFKTVTTFGNTPDVFLLELTFWGQRKP